ncbi:MAG: formylglycine-generating enzyme family protein [Prevotellaceae bacterium]|nr:formylglycine-generating enzyme family protein [Prevotellaceae bacterium]
MKKTIIFLLLLLLTGAGEITGAYAQKPKLAVLVVGMPTDAEGDEFAAGLGYDLTRSGAYDLLTKDNSPVVASKLTALRTQHAQGAKVDTTGLAAWGKANGIGFVQLVVERTGAVQQATSVLVAGQEQVAQLVDCSTGKLMGRGTYRATFGSPVELTLQLVSVTGGVFEMGCKSGRDGTCYTNETLHWVQVNDFHITKYEVTQAQWKAVMGSLPSSITNNNTYLSDDKPVFYVSHDDIAGANGFLERLNALTGQRWRLPTEAEWEYAARGCSAGDCESFEFSGSNTVADVAWYSNNASPQPVGTKAPNKLGIYDMTGNVWEWCSDWYDQYYGAGSESALTSTTSTSPIVNPTGAGTGPDRVARSGKWNDYASVCRAAFRYHNTPNHRGGVGIRLVLP